MECAWCNQEFNGTMAASGTGTTWMLYKCPHCQKFMAIGWYIPDAAKTSDTKVIETKPIGLDAGKYPDSTRELAHILWRTAKQLVSLLEKEYGFGQYSPQIGMHVEKPAKPWTVPEGHQAGSTDFVG